VTRHTAAISSTREPNGYREYGADAVQAVQTVKELLQLGFPTTLIAQILPCTNGGPRPSDDCGVVLRRVAGIRDDMQAKARQLTTTNELLTRFPDGNETHPRLTPDVQANSAAVRDFGGRATAAQSHARQETGPILT
jgi:DNA-binding transcriptional MerR regulator